MTPETSAGHYIICRQFTFGELLRFAFPSIVMMLVISLYNVVDGLFIANFVGTNALSALNITTPVMGVIIAVGMVFATGGSAYVGNLIGKQETISANRDFTLIVLTGFIISCILSAIAILHMNELLTLLGANSELMQPASAYLRIIMIFSPLLVLQVIYQELLITAGHPKLGLTLILLAGVANIIFDFIFIVLFDMGMAGAAYATAIGFAIPALGGSIFFLIRRYGLRFAKPVWNARAITRSVFNGGSEMITALSGSLVILIFNLILMQHVGPDGVAANTVIAYSEFLAMALFMGISIGVAPVISAHFGAKNWTYLKNVIRNIFIFVMVCSIALFLVMSISTEFVAGMFSESGTAVHSMIVSGMRLFAFSFLFSGICVFGSALFTALSDGKRSMIIAVTRTICIIICALCLTSSIGVLGIWASTPVAEFAAVLVVLYFVLTLKKRLHFENL